MKRCVDTYAHQGGGGTCVDTYAKLGEGTLSAFVCNDLAHGHDPLQQGFLVRAFA